MKKMRVVCAIVYALIVFSAPADAETVVVGGKFALVCTTVSGLKLAIEQLIAKRPDLVRDCWRRDTGEVLVKLGGDNEFVWVNDLEGNGEGWTSAAWLKPNSDTR